MSIARSKIVSAFRDVIKHADTLARKNVSTYRVSPNWFEDLPAINVYPTHESSGEIFNQSPLSFKRRLEISVECVVSDRDEDAASDKLDALMAQVEQAIGYKFSYDKEFRCLFNKYFPVEVELDFAENGKQIVAGGKINYEIEYIDEAVQDQPTLDAFERANVSYAISGSETKTDDLIELEQ